jgi:hypothetical protein
LTTWTTNNLDELELVTTGDGIASRILDGMRQIQPNNDIILEVFKVPHHGSEKNSQLGNLTSDDEAERKHHVFMVMALCYLFSIEFSKFTDPSHLGVLNKVRNTILHRLPREPEYLGSHVLWMDHVKDVGREFGEQELSKEKLRLVEDGNISDLGDTMNLAGFTLDLAERYQAVVAGEDTTNLMTGARYMGVVNQWDYQKIMGSTKYPDFYRNVEKDGIFIQQLRVAWSVERFYSSFR